MIDIENRVFTTVKNHIIETYGELSMATEFDASPSSFPHISIVEEDNSNYSRTVDSGSNENHVKVMYEVNIYTNSTIGRKLEAKTLLGTVDTLMLQMGFDRISKTALPTSTMYRIVIRYQGIVSQNYEIYRR